MEAQKLFLGNCRNSLWILAGSQCLEDVGENQRPTERIKPLLCHHTAQHQIFTWNMYAVDIMPPGVCMHVCVCVLGHCAMIHKAYFLGELLHSCFDGLFWETLALWKVMLRQIASLCRQRCVKSFQIANLLERLLAAMSKWHIWKEMTHILREDCVRLFINK